MNELQTKTQAEITIAPTGALMPRNFEGLYRLATIMSASGLMPKGMERPESVFVAVQMGMEVGLSPMQAVQNIASINGRPTIWGDAMLGLVRGSGLMEAIKEDRQGEGDQMEAICQVWRKDEEEPAVGRFSVADAKRAQLWGKPGPWTQYPKRMLQMRARAFALRDKFPDVLKGLHAREEFEGAQEVYMGQAHVVDAGQAEDAVSKLNAMAHAEPAQGRATGWPKDIDGNLVDVNGTPWNERFHASTRVCTEDGSWKMRRGHDPELYRRWLESLKHPDPAEQQKAEAVVDPETAGRDAYKTLEERMTQAHNIGDAGALKAAIQDAERSTELTETERDDLTNLGADLWMDMEASA